jgi:lysophospholipid acyltransferase (LPLAT)-like uncharacterized protein
LHPTEAFPTIAAVPKKREQSRLSNSIYEQQTRSGRRLSAGRRLLYRLAAPLVSALLHALWRWTRVRRVIGAEHLTQALAHTPAFIPVYWHQNQLLCSKYLFDNPAVKLGLLISPSVDGEFGAMLVKRLGGEVIRGSSTHTGARALRDFYQALVQEGISPVIAPDGPKGPPHKAKPGALLLAQLSQRPILPLSFYANRAWHVGWDDFVIPKPFSRAVIAVGEPMYVAKGMDAATLERLQAELEQRLGAVFESARQAFLSDCGSSNCNSASS